MLADFLTDGIAVSQKLNVRFFNIFIQFFRNRAANAEIDLIGIRFMLNVDRERVRNIQADRVLLEVTYFTGIVEIRQ